MQRKIVQDAARDAAAALPGPLFPPILDAFVARAILATDGTVTNLLEEFCEPVGIEKLAERLLEVGTVDDWPELERGARVASREVVVRGQQSGRIYLHAESLIAVDRLDDVLRRELLESDKPIGKLICEYRRETYRELLGRWLEEAGDLARYFGCAKHEAVWARTYRIHLGGQPTIQITERFPAGPGIAPPAREPREADGQRSGGSER
jgi:chorismate-pyruvate lyase